jgi:hypothetical protein
MISKEYGGAKRTIWSHFGTQFGEKFGEVLLLNRESRQNGPWAWLTQPLLKTWSWIERLEGREF